MAFLSARDAALGARNRAKGALEPLLAILRSVPPAALLCLCIVASRGEALARVSAGDSAPDFTLTTLDGGSDSLSSHRGRIVFLDFWATWCTPCAAELTCLASLRDSHGAGKVDVLAVNIDRDAKDARAFASTRLAGVNATLLHDPESSVLSSYGGEGLPSFFLIDGGGRVREAHGGAGGCAAAKQRLAELQPAGSAPVESNPADP